LFSFVGIPGQRERDGMMNQFGALGQIFDEQLSAWVRMWPIATVRCAAEFWSLSAA
jgi:hypothetical protein